MRGPGAGDPLSRPIHGLVTPGELPGPVLVGGTGVEVDVLLGAHQTPPGHEHLPEELPGVRGGEADGRHLGAEGQFGAGPHKGQVEGPGLALQAHVGVHRHLDNDMRVCVLLSNSQYCLVCDLWLLDIFFDFFRLSANLVRPLRLETPSSSCPECRDVPRGPCAWPRPLQR